MSSPKFIKRLITGILCAGMIFQSMPINAYANENAFSFLDGEIVDETAIFEAQSKEAAEKTDAQAAKTGENETEAAKINEIETNEAKISEASAEIEITDVIEMEEAVPAEDSVYETESVEEWEEGQASNESSSESGSESSSESDYVNMEAEFPDKVFREKVIGGLKSVNPGVDLTKVTKDMLAEITDDKVAFARKSYDIEPIKNIDGIQYLTGLTDIDLSYNEISNAVEYLDGKLIEWKNLTRLKSINLNGNDINALPRFYENRNLRSVGIIENLLTQQQIKDFLANKIPPSESSGSSVTLPDETVFSQRTGTFSDKVHVEQVYYEWIDGAKRKVPFIIMVGGYKSGLPYKLEFFIDGAKVELENKDGYENVYYKEDSGLEKGEHRIQVKLEQNGKSSAFTDVFDVAEQDCYPAKDLYRFSSNSTDDLIDLYYPYSTADKIERLTITDANGKEFEYANASFDDKVETHDYRYMNIKGDLGLYIKEKYMNHTAVSMKEIIKSIPSGTYSLNLFLGGQEEPSYKLENLITVKSAATDNWKCILSSDTVYYNDARRNKAEISVTEAGGKRVEFVIEKTTGVPVSLKADKNNNRAVVTAGEGTGSATVKITVGSSILRRTIEVKERIYADSIAISTPELKIIGPGRVGDADVIIAPEGALDIREELEVTTSDRNVFVVERQEDIPKKGVKITVKSTGLGEAVLTVKVKSENPIPPELPLTVSCDIKVVDGNFSEIEKQTLITNVGTTYCITNINGTRLGNLPLPDGWEWLEPETQVSIDEEDPSKVQRYAAKYSRDGYASFKVPIPVAVTQITGAEVTGPSELTKGKNGSYTANLKYNGYNVGTNKSFTALVDKAVSVDWSADSVFTLSSQKGKSITAAAGSVSAVTEGIITASVKAGNDIFEIERDVRVIPEHITKIKITPAMASKNSVSYRYNELENALYVDEADVTGESYKIKFKVEAGTDDKPSVNVTKGTFKWTINDPAFGEIKEASDGTVQLYINKGKKSGTIILRATADDIRNNYAEVFVEMRDYSPIVETDAITVYKLAETGTELPVYAVEGNAITKAVIDHEDFKIEKSVADSRRFLINIKKDKKEIYQKNTTVDAKLTINTQTGRVIERDVKITVDTGKPKIKFVAKTAPNLFYADTTAQYTIDAEYDIADIQPAQDGRNTGFVFKSYDKITGVLTVEAKGLNKSTLDEFKNKNSDFCNLPLMVEYKGYGIVSENLNVSAKSSKPSVKAEETAMMYDRQPADAYLIDAKTKKKLALAETSSVSSLTDTVMAIRKDTGILLEFMGDKSTGYKLLLSDANWTEDINASGRITMVQNLLTLLDMQSICLNMAHNVNANGSVPVSVSIKNSLIDVVDVRYAAADQKAEQLIESGYLNVSYDAVNDILNFGLNDDRPLYIKAGSYKLNVYAVIGNAEGGMTELTPAVLTISLADAAKAPKVKLSGKGQINLIDRENTAVIYTVAVSNMTSAVKSVTATGANAKLFNARLADGKIEVRADNSKSAAINIANYKLNLLLGFENNTSIQASVNIKPVCKAPKLEASSKTGVIYKAVNNDLQWKLYNKGRFGRITGIKLADSRVKQPFAITSADDGTITLKLADDAKRTVKKGKYTVSYQVIFSGMPIGAPPAAMKMSVVVK